MADNISIPTGGVVVSTDDVGGVQVQRVKVQFGVDGSSDDVHAGNRLPVVVDTADTPATTDVPASLSSVTLLASNSGRKGAMVQNESPANLYLKFGLSASTTSYSALIPAGAYFEVPFHYTGVLTGCSDEASGTYRVTELT